MTLAFQFLKQSQIFQHLQEKELLLLADHLTRCVYLKNEIIFRENDIANQLYFVLKGQVKIYKNSQDGKEYILDIISEQQMFAEVPMFTGKTYPANAIATADTIVFTLLRNQLIQLIRENPQIALNLLAAQAEKLREFTIKLEQFSFQKIDQKLLNYLKNNQSEKMLKMQELASYFGVSRETLSRAVSQLIKNGQIKKVGKILKCC